MLAWRREVCRKHPARRTTADRDLLLLSPSPEDGASGRRGGRATFDCDAATVTMTAEPYRRRNGTRPFLLVLFGVALVAAAAAAAATLLSRRWRPQRPAYI